MKKIVMFTFLFTGVTISAQKVTTASLNQIELNIHKKIVKQALTYSDVQTAINSMHTIVALEGLNSTYKDTLAITYFNIRNYASSYLLSKELLEKKKNNLQLLEINAISLEQLGQTREAITAYEKLFSKTNSMAHGFQLASLQFGIKRLAEAQFTINKTMQSEVVKDAYMPLPVSKNENQNVPLQAAAYNLQGLIAYNLKDYKTAHIAFKESLKIMPKFALAINNANALSKEFQNAKLNSNKK